MWVLRTTAAALVILQSGGSGDMVPREKNQPGGLFHTASALDKDAVNNIVIAVNYYFFKPFQAFKHIMLSDSYLPLRCPLLISYIDSIFHKQPKKSKGSFSFFPPSG